MNKSDVNHHERLQTAAKARQAMLAKAAALSPKNAPDYAERQAERLAISIARDQRKAEAAARKQAEAARIEAEKAAAALAAQLAAEAARVAQELEKARAAEERLALKAAQKEITRARHRLAGRAGP